MGRPKKSNESRYYQYVVGIEHAAYNPMWLKKAIEYGVPFAVSPLHCSDSECGYFHYHVLVDFRNYDTYLVKARNFAKILGCAGDFAMMTEHPYLFYRYLTHADQPEKQQFKGIFPTHYNGFQIPQSEIDKTLLHCMIQDDIINLNITEYVDLIAFYKLCNDDLSYQKRCYAMNSNDIKALITSNRLKKTIDEGRKAYEIYNDKRKN